MTTAEWIAIALGILALLLAGFACWLDWLIIQHNRELANKHEHHHGLVREVHHHITRRQDGPGQRGVHGAHRIEEE